MLGLEPFQPGCLVCPGQMGLGFLRQAQEVVGVALTERFGVSRSARAARRRTRGSSPASRSAPPSTGAGSCRRATAGRRGSRPTTSSAASRVQPPRKTASRAKRSFSSSVSRSYDHSIVARSVRWRSGASRAPPVRSGSRCSSRSRICARRERLHACRRQLEREREVVQAPADLRDCVVGRRSPARPPSRAQRRSRRPPRVRARAPGTPARP